MKRKLFKMTPEEQLIFFEQRNFKIAKVYEKNLERAKKTLLRIEKVVFEYDLKLSEYELTFSRILQVEGIYLKALNEEIILGFGMPEGHTYSNHRIEHSYNKYNDYIKKSLITLSKYKEILADTIRKKTNNLSSSKEVLSNTIKKNGLDKAVPLKERKGFSLGFTKEQLKLLLQKLIEEGFIATNTPEKFFINAFNGSILENFKPLKWKNQTKGAIFIKYYLGDEKNFWSKYNYLFEKASYKHLLSQSKNLNNTFDLTIKQLEMIDSTIKYIDCIDCK